MSAMVRVRTAELTGTALDVAVALATGWKLTRPQDAQVSKDGLNLLCGEAAKRHSRYVFTPSTDWSQGGPLMEECNISVIAEDGMGPRSFWAGTKPLPDSMFGFNYAGANAYGETILIGVCRAIVIAKLGDEVELPQELLG